MKEYKDYMDDISVDAELHNKILRHIAPATAIREKLMKSFFLRRIVLVASVIALSLSAVTISCTALNRRLVDRTDTGGRELVTVPDKSQVGFSGDQAGFSGDKETEDQVIVNSSVSFLGDVLLNFDDETAAMINEALIKQLLF